MVYLPGEMRLEMSSLTQVHLVGRSGQGVATTRAAMLNGPFSSTWIYPAPICASAGDGLQAGDFPVSE